MKRGRLLALLGLVGSFAVVGAVALVVLVSAFGGDLTEGETSAVRESQDNAAGSPADPSDLGEGIQVHGDWVIEVRNEDGSLAERREFENALSGGGQALLTQSLARTASPGVWGIVLNNEGDPNPDPMAPGACGPKFLPDSNCVIHEPISSLWDNGGGVPGPHFPTLTVTGDQFGPFEVVLQGNFDAPVDGTIGRVQTLNCFNQPANIDPGACINLYLVTETTLVAPVDILAGQQVLVTVRISFS